MDRRQRNGVSVRELGGFGVIVGAFIVLFWALDVAPQSWESFGLLAAALAALVGYRVFLARRHADG